MAGGSKVNGTLVEVEQNLKDEEQRLLQMKELILKEMKVLKVTYSVHLDVCPYKTGVGHHLVNGDPTVGSLGILQVIFNFQL